MIRWILKAIEWLELRCPSKKKNKWEKSSGRRIPGLQSFNGPCAGLDNMRWRHEQEEKDKKLKEQDNG